MAMTSQPMPSQPMPIGADVLTGFMLMLIPFLMASAIF